MVKVNILKRNAKIVNSINIFYKYNVLALYTTPDLREIGRF